MKDDSASYYDSREFTELLASYENMLADGGSVYFDSMDIANIAEYYSMNGDLDKSDTAIEYGLRLHPSDSDILISKGNNLLRRGLKDEARVLTESISDPDNQELLYLKGEIELAFDRPDDADAYFTQAVQLSDDDPGMLNDIIVKYMDNRNYDLCQKWLDMALVTQARQTPQSSGTTTCLTSSHMTPTTGTSWAVYTTRRMITPRPASALSLSRPLSPMTNRPA